MDEPLEEEYFNWLCAKVVETGSNNYYALLEILHTTEFVWVVHADKHRAEDGLELRRDFLREMHYKRNQLWEEEPCSVFELLVAFAKRAAFQTEISVKDWFWIFITNLHLSEYRRVYDSDRHIIDDILDTFIWRHYDSYGYGGLFPLDHTAKDQRQVELWYQLAEWIEDQGLL